MALQAGTRYSHADLPNRLKLCMQLQSKARIIGAMILLAMAASVAGNLILQPVLQSENFLVSISDKQSSIHLFGFLMLINSLAVAAAGIVSFTAIKDHQPLVATSYLATRIAEAVILAVGFIAILALTNLGQQFSDQGRLANPALESLGKSLIATNWFAYHTAMVALGYGSLAFVWCLMKLGLAPRLLCMLGLLGYTILATASVANILGYDPGLIVTLPTFVFEVSLGLYLVVKGFSNQQSLMQDVSTPITT